MCSINEIESIVKIILEQTKESQEKGNKYPDEFTIIDSTSLVLLIFIILIEIAQVYFHRLKIKAIMAQQIKDSIQIDSIQKEKQQGLVHVEDANEIFVTTAHELNLMSRENEEAIADQIRALNLTN